MVLDGTSLVVEAVKKINCASCTLIVLVLGCLFFFEGVKLMGIESS